MVSTIDTAFIEQYNADAHNAYQRDGFMMQRMTRSGTVRGTTVYWQKVAALTAQDKPRNAMHSFTDMTHTRVSATMVDKYVPTLIDDLDLLKLNIEERQLHATNHMYALGNWADEQIRDAMETGANATDLGGGSTVTMTVAHMLNVVDAFNEGNIPNDGNRFCMVSAKTWSKMLRFDEFSNADYVGPDRLPFNGLTAKNWAGVFWFMNTLPNVDTGATEVATNLAWHKRAVGHGMNKSFDIRITYENIFSAYAAVSSCSQGAAVIDSNAVWKFSVDEDA